MFSRLKSGTIQSQTCVYLFVTVEHRNVSVQAPETSDEPDTIHLHSAHHQTPCLHCVSYQQTQAEGGKAFFFALSSYCFHMVCGDFFLYPPWVLHVCIYFKSKLRPSQLRCCSHALNPILVCILDLVPAGSRKESIRSCRSHLCGSTDTGEGWKRGHGQTHC